MVKMGFSCNRNWNFTLVIETIIFNDRSIQRRSSLMSILDKSHFLLTVLALGFALYITKDKWRGKIGL